MLISSSIRGNGIAIYVPTVTLVSCEHLSQMKIYNFIAAEPPALTQLRGTQRSSDLEKVLEITDAGQVWLVGVGH